MELKYIYQQHPEFQRENSVQKSCAKILDINTLTNAISLVGFPVIMCGALFWYIYTSQAKTQEILMELTQVISELKVVIQNDEK